MSEFLPELMNKTTLVSVIQGVNQLNNNALGILIYLFIMIVTLYYSARTTTMKQSLIITSFITFIFGFLLYATGILAMKWVSLSIALLIAGLLINQVEE